MAKVETEILNQSALKLLAWKRFIEEICSSRTPQKKRSHSSLNKLTNTIKLSSLRLKYPKQKQTSWTVYKGELFKTESVLNVRTHFKPTETLQYTHFSTCHPSGVKRRFIKGKALRLLRTNSSETLFEESITNFKTHLLERTPRELYSNNPLRSYF